MKRTFRSLASHNFRLWFLTALASNVGTWMQATAQSWVVLTELTDEDAVAAGITMALQITPQILLAPVTGLIADRFDRRKLLIATQAAATVLSLLVGALLASGQAELWHFYVFAGVFGLIMAIDQPARQAFVSDLVGDDHISNAVALNLASHHAARLVGPAAAGIVIAVAGSGWVFIVNAVTFTPTLIALLRMRRDEMHVAPVPARRRGDLLAGFVYIWRRTDLRVVELMLLLLGIIGMNFALFASLMAVEFGAGAEEFGLLTSVMAIGSLAGALVSAGRERARIRVIVVAAALLGTTALASAFMPTFWTFALSTIAIGFMGVTTFTTANGYVQTTTPAPLRGRVMSIHSAVLGLGTPIGAPIIGVVSNEFGPRLALGSCFGLAVIACAIGVGWYLLGPRRRRRAADDPSPSGPPALPVAESPEQLTLSMPLEIDDILDGGPDRDPDGGPAPTPAR